MKSPRRAKLAVRSRAEPARCAWAARQEQYRRTNDRKQQILVRYKRESMLANMKAQRGFVFPWAMLLNPTVLLGIALAAASGFGYLQTVRLGAAQDRLIASQARFDQFRATVQAEGKLALERAETQRQKDLQRAKEADDEAKKRYRSLDAAYAAYRMRQRAGSGATERLVSAAPAGTPDGDRVCYSRETLDREITGALDRFRGRLAQSVEPYDRATALARVCRDWAVGR